MRYGITLLSTIFLVLVYSLPAWSGSLNIATLDLAPFGFEKDGQKTGVLFEIGNAIANEGSYTPKNTLLPFGESLDALQSGKADLLIAFPNPTLEKYGVNMGFVLALKNVIMPRADTLIRNFNDMRGKKVATVRGAKYDDRISPKNGITIIPLKNYKQCLKMLLSKQVDAVAAPLIGIMYTARIMGIPPQALGDPLTISVGQTSVFLSTKTATPEMKTKIAKAISTISINGTVQYIRGKY